jgi:Spy/CpxP family protein refolding chaperone
MIRVSCLIGSALALVLLVTSSAQAQLGRGGGMRIPPTVTNIMMMRSEPVQKELALSPEQTKSITEIATQMQAEAMEIMSGLQDLTPEERQAEMANVMSMVSDRAKELQKKVDEILDDKQTDRVKQLSLQQRGVDALGDEEVIGALKLTPEQLAELVKIRDDAQAKTQEIVQEALGQGGDREKIREKLQAFRKEVGDKAFAVLTAEQKDQFEKMKGAKFDFPRGGRGPFGF